MTGLRSPTTGSQAIWGGQGLTQDQQAMVAFATRWEPYGGGGEDEIFPLFGIPVREFYRRVHDLVDASPSPELDEVTRNRLRTFCITKLNQIALRPRG
jgi:hypothetical protein